MGRSLSSDQIPKIGCLLPSNGQQKASISTLEHRAFKEILLVRSDILFSLLIHVFQFLLLLLCIGINKMRNLLKHLLVFHYYYY